MLWGFARWIWKILHDIWWFWVQLQLRKHTHSVSECGGGNKWAIVRSCKHKLLTYHPHVAKLCAGTQRLCSPVAWLLLRPCSPGSVKVRGLHCSGAYSMYDLGPLHPSTLTMLSFWTCLHFTAQQQMLHGIIPCGLDQTKSLTVQAGRLAMVWTRKNQQS